MTCIESKLPTCGHPSGPLELRPPLPAQTGPPASPLRRRGQTCTVTRTSGPIFPAFSAEKRRHSHVGSHFVRFFR